MKGNARTAFRIFLLFLGMAVLLAGCGASRQKITSQDMTICLTSDYQNSPMKNTTWHYRSINGPEAIGIRSMKDDLEKKGLETNSPEDYAEAYIRANKIKDVKKIVPEKDFVYFEYQVKRSKSDYSYMTFIYEHDDEIWLVNFSCYTEVYHSYRSSFLKAAKSVEFSEDPDQK